LAASSGTLICLGANEIVMSKYGSLSPIDPTTANKFNPTNPHDGNKVVPISVEDVSSFLALAQEKALIRGEAETLELFKDLTGERPMSIHPLALGNVYRALRLIRDIAKKQMLLHEDNIEKIERSIEHLTELLYSHQYLIDREELKRIELKIVNSESVPLLDDTMWSLYKEYEDDIKMLEPFNPQEIIANNPQPAPINLPQIPANATPAQIQQLLMQAQNRQPPVSVNFSNSGAFIESSKITHSYLFEGRVIEIRTPNNVREINVEMKAYWKKIR